MKLRTAASNPNEAHFSRIDRMLREAAYAAEMSCTMERFVTAAIIQAREVCTDCKWLSWADHWLSGCDRSFASARVAHRDAHRVCERESIERSGLTDSASANTKSGREPLETPADLAAWAAGLALLTAPVTPDLGAGIRRMEFAARSRISARQGYSRVASALVGRAAQVLQMCALPAPMQSGHRHKEVSKISKL
jgi:hypothetical protein